MRLLKNSIIASCFVTTIAVPLPDGAGRSKEERQQHGNQQGLLSQQMQNQAGDFDVARVGRAIASHGLAATAGAGLVVWILNFKKQAAAKPYGRATSPNDAGNQHKEGTARRYTEEELADRASDARILTCVAECISERRYGMGLDDHSPLLRFDSYAYLVFGRSCLEGCVREADEVAGEAGSSRSQQAPLPTDNEDDEASDIWGFRDANPSQWASSLKRWGKDGAFRVGAGLLRATNIMRKIGAMGKLVVPDVPADRLPGSLVP